jgi:hypothetical protein
MISKRAPAALSFGVLALLAWSPACSGKVNEDAGGTGDDPAGICTRWPCAPQPGDCGFDRCTRWDIACAAGTPTHLRCVPSPYGGSSQGECLLESDCTGILQGRAPSPEQTCAKDACDVDAVPRCVVGEVSHLACIHEASGDPNCIWDWSCE